MGRKTFQVIFSIALHIACCASAPTSQQQIRRTLVTAEDAPLVLGEGLVSAELNLQPHANREESKNVIEPAFETSTVEKIGKSENDPVDFGNDEYIAELPEKQYAPSELLNVDNKRASVRIPSSSGAVTVASANPIYITIPIYLSKGEGQPLRLSVGGQEIPLTPKAVTSNGRGRNGESLSPTSQFNRLLKQNDEEPKKHKKSSKKSSKKKKRHHTSSARKATSSSSSADRGLDTHSPQLHSYRFYF